MLLLSGEFCPLGNRESRVMEIAFERLELSVRAYHRIIKTARTIADLEGEERIREEHLLEALGFRARGSEILEPGVKIWKIHIIIEEIRL